MAQDETSFGALLRHYRLAATLSQEGLAERAGISPGTVRALERGRHGAPQPETLAQLAAALGLADAERAALVAAATAPRAGSAPADAASSAGARAPSTLAPAPSTAGEPLEAAPPASRHNLPAALSALVGRERERAAVAALLSTARLVTLTGTGGVGKTRLALATATAAVDAYPDGVWLVELAPLADPALVPGAVAAALGVREEPGRPMLPTLAATLRERALLLLLDNCEHLVGACAALAQALLAACPALRVLATSREPLGLPGEQRYHVPSLSAPDRCRLPAAELAGSFEAVRLFAARARERVPGFTLEGPEARAAMEVCARLDGIPLAIELAAAWVGLLPVEDIAARLGDRFRLLTKGARTAPSRQRTLRAALDWSWDLLEERERALLARLSAFAGGWTLAGARAVCGEPGQDEWATLAGLAALEERSLLAREGPEAGGEGRYRLLETVRQYAAERLAALGEAATTRDRHLAHYLGLAEEAAPGLTGPEQAAWLDRLEAEHDNLRAALGWGRERGAAEAGLRLAAALGRFWQARGYFGEGQQWLAGALAAGAAGPAARAAALDAAGRLAYQLAEYGRAATLHEEALTLWRGLGDRRGAADSLNNLGNVAYRQGDNRGAATLYEESLALRRDLGDQRGIAASLNNLGIVAWDRGEYGRAAALYEQALALQRALGDRWGIAHSLTNLGNVVDQVGEYGRAMALYEEALALRRDLGDRWGIAYSLNNLGAMADDHGDHARAAALHEEALALRRDLGDRLGIAASLSNLGVTAERRGDFGRAAALQQEALALQRELGDRWGIATSLNKLGIVAYWQGDLARATALLGESLALARELDARILHAHAVAYLAHIAGRRGDASRAATLYQDAVRLSREAEDRYLLPTTLEGWAWATHGLDAERAARLFGAAEALRAATGAPLAPHELREREGKAATLREALGAPAFEAALVAGRAWPPEEALAAALTEGADPVG